MPTRAGIATAVFGVLCLGAGRVFAIFELYIVAAAMLALVGCAIVWVLANWRALDVSRAVRPSRLHVGSSSVVTLTLSNLRFAPSPVSQVTDEVNGVPRANAHVPPLRRNRSTQASYRVPAEVRGRIALGPMQTRVADPFALASSVRQSAPDVTVLVLPAFDVIAPPPQPSGRVASRSDRSPGRIGAHGDDFSSLRSYVVGDDLRKVHWPSTARSGELVVRTEHVPEHGHSLVLLDVRASVAAPETFERMVSAATSILIACFDRGDELRFATTSGLDLRANDQRTFDTILDRLALIEQVPAPSAHIVDDADGLTEAAVVVMGSGDTFAFTPGVRGAPPQELTVRFVDAVPTPSEANGALPSRRMVTVAPNDDFASLWTVLVGPRPPSRPSPL